MNVLYVHQISICMCEVKLLKYTHPHLGYIPSHRQSIIFNNRFRIAAI